MDVKMAPQWSHFGSTFFFQCCLLEEKKFDWPMLEESKIKKENPKDPSTTKTTE